MVGGMGCAPHPMIFFETQPPPIKTDVPLHGALPHLKMKSPILKTNSPIET